MGATRAYRCRSEMSPGQQCVCSGWPGVGQGDTSGTRARAVAATDGPGTPGRVGGPTAAAPAPRAKTGEEGWWFRSFLHCDPSWLLCPAAYRLERTYHYLVRSTCRREDRSSRDVHSLVVDAALPCQHRHSAPPARGAGRRVVRGAGESQPPLPTDDSALRKSACDLGLSLVAALPLAPEWWGHRPTSQTRRGRAGGLATARTSVRSPHTRCRYRCTRPESGR